MRPAIRTRSSAAQQGSTTVLVVFLLPTMLLMLMLVSNVSQAVYEKVRLQNTVDACALAAATVQAVGLNEIADLNFELTLELVKLKAFLLSTIWYSQADAQGCVNFFQKVFDAIHDYQDKANSDYARNALRIAEKVKNDNLPAATLKSVNPRDEKLITYTTGSEFLTYTYRIYNCCPCSPINCSCNCCGILPTQLWVDALAQPAKYTGRHDGRVSSPICGTTMVGNGSVTTSITKDREPMAYAAFKLTQPAHEFKFAGGIFGKLDELTAYAGAKPAGGTIALGQPSYKPVMVKLTSLAPKPNVPDLSRFQH
jgi:hypothetical protein